MHSLPSCGCPPPPTLHERLPWSLPVCVGICLTPSLRDCQGLDLLTLSSSGRFCCLLWLPSLPSHRGLHEVCLPLSVLPRSFPSAASQILHLPPWPLQEPPSRGPSLALTPHCEQGQHVPDPFPPNHPWPKAPPSVICTGSKGPRTSPLCARRPRCHHA